jgi:adenine-specific DNA-methyltransferase
MEKMKMHSPNLTQDNVARIRELFPNCVTEAQGEDGAAKLAVDFDLLRQELTESIVEGPHERYHLNWPGKREALFAANAPIAKTLRPKKDQSLEFESTQNLFIEGDNLDALKLMQETYLGKIKVIYIDPPYNTGSDLIYADDYADDFKAYIEKSNQVDDAGNRMIANCESNGRFHSDWLSMIYPRLKLARNLLSDDGVIFLSIGDREIDNAKKLLTEVFGEGNCIATAVWEKKNKGAFLSNDITNIKDYILVYSKSQVNFSGLIGEIAEHEETYPCVNAPNARDIRKIPPGIKSKYREKNYSLPAGSVISADTMSLVLHSDLVIENGLLKNELVIEGNWRYKQDAMKEYAEKGELYLTQDLYLRRIVRDPRYKTLRDLLPRIGNSGNPASYPFDTKDLFKEGWGTNEDANEELRQVLGEQNLFSYPKPTSLISKLICSVRDSNCTVLDFFSGSGTTAHAVALLNLLDGGSRKYVLVQMPESLDPEIKEQKAAANYCTKNGLDLNIAELTKERIRRAGKKILKDFDHHEGVKKLDLGFRVLKVDSSNMAEVFYSPDNISQDLLRDQIDNVRSDRTAEDLLFQVMLDWGVDLTLPIAKQTIQGKEVSFVDGNALAACFDNTGSIDEAFVKELAKQQPLRVVFRDAGFKDSAGKINVEQIFKLLSPATDVKHI